MARKVETEWRATGGLEATLDTSAVCVLLIGFVGAIALVGVFRLGGVVASIGILFNSFVGYLLLRSIAEIIRLLKKTANIPYSGNISQGTRYSVFSCSDCNAMLHSGLRCDSCGADIEVD